MGLGKGIRQLGSSRHAEHERQKHDYYATDPKVIEDIFRKESFKDDVWECACGEGHLSKKMKEHGKNVYSTDLIDRGYGDDFFDFLEDNPHNKTEKDIITNPPYKLAKEFVEKSLDLQIKGCKTAMFLKIQFLESLSRIELFKKHPPKKIYVYSKRQKCVINGNENISGNSAMCYAWFIWEKGYSGDTNLSWIFPKKYRDKQEVLL